jgi:hypothetical protein
VVASVYGFGNLILVPVAVKTANYTAAPNQFVPCDVSGGSLTVTLPSAPQDASRAGVKLVKLSGTSTVTVAAAGGATFNDDGTTSVTLKLLNQGMMAQFDAALNVWYVQSDDLPLSQLDARYNAANFGLQFLTGGGAITTSTITSAKTAGFTGIFLDPRFVWTIASTLVINGIQGFIIESRMIGSIGWGGGIAYNTSGYISTGATSLDGIQILATTPAGTTATQGIIFRNVVIVGANAGHAVVHFGGGQRRCGMERCLVYNTSSAANSYAVTRDTALSDNNSENDSFIDCDWAGAYAALGLGVGDQTQHTNDTDYYGLTTAGGQYSIYNVGSNNHHFFNYYDRSNPAVAVVYAGPNSSMFFYGGEDRNTTVGGTMHTVAGGSVVLLNRTVTDSSNTAALAVSSGSLAARGRCRWGGTVALSGTGNVDLSDPAGSYSGLSISGSAGTLMVAGNYNPASGPVVTSWTGTTLTYPPVTLPAVEASGLASGATTTQTLTWTPPAAITRFRVSLHLRVTTAGTSTVPNLSFTQFGGSAFNQALWVINAATGAAVSSVIANGVYTVTFEAATDGSGTAITLTITPTGSTFTWDAVIERLT